MTNYEHIRNMSVEEMAFAMLRDIEKDVVCEYCKPTLRKETKHCNGKCTEGIKKWLESEVEE